jgi:transketolase
VFSDYMRGSVRLSALTNLHSIWVYTHDSIAVGEDGPTHEPVEHVMSLRLIPNLYVIRPADANETTLAWKSALTHHRPTALILSRQDLPILDQSQAIGTASRGGYILSGPDDAAITIIATGSEVSLAVGAQEILGEHGISARVVSLPSWEIFARQDAEYQNNVLGPESTPRLSIEAGVTTGWQKFVGSHGRSLGIDHYGASGPGAKVLAHFGFTKEHAAAEAFRLLGKPKLAAEVEPEGDGGEIGGEEAKGGEGHS